MCTATPVIKFGTDGWRGVISDDFTFENVRLVAQAVADYYYQACGTNRPLRFAVGFDTRFLSDRYARSVSEILAANGIEVFLSDRCIPTPALSFAVKNRSLDAGLMITASHNPGMYNGIKIKTAEGGAAGVDVTRAVEGFIREPATPRTKPAAAIQTVDFTEEYVRFLRSYVDLKKLARARFSVLVDSMHGSGDSFLARVLEGTSVRLDFVRAEVNPSFGGLKPEPVLENLRQTVERMRRQRYDLAIVLDGDADRIAAFAGNAEFINPQKVLGLLILHLIQDRAMAGGVVKTLVGSNLIDNVCQKLALKLYETPVGFKYISELMVKENIVVGGEEAGGMGFKDYIPERDGSLAGLLLLEMMVDRRKPILAILNQMEKEFGRYYYLRTEVKLTEARAGSLESFKGLAAVAGRAVVKVDASDGLKFFLEDSSWLMLRASGTEPIIRVYAESKSQEQSEELLDFGKKLFSRNAL